MIYFSLIIFALILLALLANNMIDKIFNEKPYYIVLMVFMYGIFINICILIYNLMIFKNKKIKRGGPGKKGDSGDQGLMGDNDTCGDCGETKQETVGELKIAEDKKEVIIETPVLSSDIRGQIL